MHLLSITFLFVESNFVSQLPQCSVVDQTDERALSFVEEHCARYLSSILSVRLVKAHFYNGPCPAE